MKTYSNEKPEVYAVSGQELRIRWNIQEVSAPSIDDEPKTQWEANEALCSVFDNRSQIIEKIIGSVHTPGAEVALINNKDINQDAYLDYQEFRLLSKELADEWLNNR